MPRPPLSAPNPCRARGWGRPPTTPPSTITWADFRAWERQLATTGTCSHPIRLTGRIEAIDRTTGETAPVYDTAAEPGGVLHVACGNRRETVCPACSAVYKRDARQLVRAGLAGGKGVPETDHGASVRVRHPHRALVRAGPLPPDARQDRAALPPTPRRRCPPLPARPRHFLPDPARRGRSPARAAHVRRLLRLRSRRAVQRPRRGRCGAGSPPTCPATWPASLASRRRRCARCCASATSRSANTRHAASSTSTPSSASTPPARTTSHPPPATPPTCCATPSARPPPPSV